MSKIRKGDQVIVRVGKDKDRTGKVLQVFPVENKVLVEGINMVRKHVRANPQIEERGGIKNIEKPIQISNVAVLNPVSRKADKVAIKVLPDGRKVRVFKSTGEQVDVR